MPTNSVPRPDGPPCISYVAECPAFFASSSVFRNRSLAGSQAVSRCCLLHDPVTHAAFVARPVHGQNRARQDNADAELVYVNGRSFWKAHIGRTMKSLLNANTILLDEMHTAELHKINRNAVQGQAKEIALSWENWARTFWNWLIGLWIGRSFCLAALRAEFSNKGHFFCTSLNMCDWYGWCGVDRIAYWMQTNWVKCTQLSCIKLTEMQYRVKQKKLH